MPTAPALSAPLGGIDREQNARAELAERIAHAVSEDGRTEPIPGLFLVRSSETGSPFYGVYTPCFCVIAQGAKTLQLGEGSHRYDPLHYLLVSADLPLVGRIVEASEDAPYLGLRLNLDPALVGQVMVEAGGLPPASGVERRALDVSPIDAESPCWAGRRTR